MHKLTLFIIIVTICYSCGTIEKNKNQLIVVNYPKTKTVDTVDTYFDVKVKDPYRWLEDDRSPATEAWVKAQNETTFKYLNQIPFRDALKTRLSQLWNYEKVSAPFTEGDYYIFRPQDLL